MIRLRIRRRDLAEEDEEEEPGREEEEELREDNRCLTTSSPIRMDGSRMTSEGTKKRDNNRKYRLVTFLERSFSLMVQFVKLLRTMIIAQLVVEMTLGIKQLVVQIELFF